ncbi:MAG TPA: hypothetical protein VHV53_00685 [Solirubrobacterales bacterium]|nr:hypothetical protein [Solirubrobacterales bacterium]
MPVKRLGIQQVLISQRHGKIGQLGEAGARDGQIDTLLLELSAQLIDVVGALLRDAQARHHCLQPLLDGLLSVEADYSSLISGLPANSRAAVASLPAFRE